MSPRIAERKLARAIARRSSASVRALEITMVVAATLLTAVGVVRVPTSWENVPWMSKAVVGTIFSPTRKWSGPFSRV
jgi:hypothetical protein